MIDESSQNPTLSLLPGPIDHEAIDHEAGTMANAGLPVSPVSLADETTPVLKALGPAPEHNLPQIPGFVVLREIGHGGMGVVYLARQESPHRDVALKMIRGFWAQEDSAQMLLRAEADAIAALNDPHIVQIYLVGEHAGQPYLAIEYCANGSLDRRLRTALPTPIDAARLVQTLAETMHKVHLANLIHRDLKPANILLTAGDSPRITDFGLARQANPTASLAGRVAGTPSYMAPEQAEGSIHIGPAVDVYALGAILYECLTGRAPFTGSSVEDILRQVKQDEPVAVRTLAPRVPRNLAVICHHCLAKDPARRYASAQDLADDLRRFLAGEPIRARPAGWIERAWRWTARNKALAALITVSSLALLAVLGLAFYFTATLASARADTATADDRRKTAEQLAEQRQFFGLMTQTTERASRRPPGWTWDNLGDLADASRLASARDYLPDLRTHAIAARSAVDLRPVEPLRPVAKPISLAADAQGRWVAVAERGVLARALLGAKMAVALVDPATGQTLRRLLAPQTSIGGFLKPAPDMLYQLAFSPDGRWMVGGSRSSRIHVWDLHQDTDQPLKSWPVPDRTARQLAFSPDGKLLYVSLAEGGPLDVYSVERWERVGGTVRPDTVTVHPRLGWVLSTKGFGYDARLEGEVRPRAPEVDDVRFSPDGASVLTCNDRTVELRDSSTWEVYRRLLAPEETTTMPAPISSLILSAAGDLLFTISSDRDEGRLWDLTCGRLVGTVGFPPGSLSAAFSADGRWLLVVTDDEVRRFEVRRFESPTAFAMGSDFVRAFCWHPDGRNVAVGRGRGTSWPHISQGELWLYPQVGSALREPLRLTPVARYGLADTVHRLAFAQADRLVVGDAGGHHRYLDTWDLTGRQDADSTREPTPGFAGSKLQALVPDGAGGVWWLNEGEIRNRRGGEDVSRWSDPALVIKGKAGANSLAAGPRWLVAGCREGVARVFGNAPGKLVEAAATQLSPHPLDRCALSPDESLAVLADADRRLYVVSVPAAERLFASELRRDTCEALDWSAAGWVAAGGREGLVDLFDWQGGKLRRLCTLPHARAILGLKFSPDGQQLLVQVRGESCLRLWDLPRLLADLGELRLADDLHLPGVAAPVAAPLPVRQYAAPPKPMPECLLRETFSDPGLIHRRSASYSAEVGFLAAEDADGTFGCRLTGELRLPAAGQYGLHLDRSDDQAFQMWLGDRVILDVPRTAPPGRFSTAFNLPAGTQTLRIETFRSGRLGPWKLLWQPPGQQEPGAIPLEVLAPPK